MNRKVKKRHAEKTAAEQRRRGRPFAPGKSGNPRGRPVGARNRTTVAAESLLAGEAEKLTRKAVRLALAGDVVALRLCLDRLLPTVRERRLSLEFPPADTAEGTAAGLTRVIQALAGGDLTVGEAQGLASVLEARRRALETLEFERRIKALECRRAGQQP